MSWPQIFHDQVMKIVTRDVPTPKKGEMLIKVAASAINRPDVIQVK